MSSVEWNKKEDLVADQALRHLKVGCFRYQLPHALYIQWLYVKIWHGGGGGVPSYYHPIGAPNICSDF